MYNINIHGYETFYISIDRRRQLVATISYILAMSFLVTRSQYIIESCSSCPLAFDWDFVKFIYINETMSQRIIQCYVIVNSLVRRCLLKIISDLGRTH